MEKISRRVILVSNRLPVAVKLDGDRLEVEASSGGLATGLQGFRASGGRTLWIGWPGAAARTDEQRFLMEQRLAELDAVPVHLSSHESQRFYEGVANGVLWPLFHYLIDRVPLVIRHWDAYVQANRRFCDVVVSHARDGDVIWIHDYQLMLLPAMLRARLPHATIGFFLHIPFPASEVFRTLPQRDMVLHGLLGADLIGFHSYDYLRHFSDSLLGLLGLEVELDHLQVDGREVRLGVFPMGIDAASFAERAAAEEVLAEMQTLRAAHGVERLLLGVDRLDYTKGIPRKVLAMERLLERTPALRGRVRLIQVAVPSRERVDAYKSLRRDVEELVGRVNGAHGTLAGAPVHYLYQSVTGNQLAASYRAADVMVVTPLRDGMNLVAKEFIASRVDGDGVLVLSELAGAASELGEALTVNPYDVEALAASFERALSMPESERRHRMAVLRQKVLARPVQVWAESYLSALEVRPADALQRDAPLDDLEVDELAGELALEPEVVLAVDYDGTLVPLRARPELAFPDAELLELLGELSRVPRTSLYVVSGRTRESMEAWLGQLPIGMIAEHGVFVRRLGEAEFHSQFDFSGSGFRGMVRAIFEEYMVRTPGAMIEEKSAGLAWHYRNAAPHLGALRSRELRMHLVQTLAQSPVNILTGHKVVEVRPQGIDKGQSLRNVLSEMSGVRAVAAFGDDRTDEDLFASVPDTRFTFCAGPLPTRARYHLDGPRQVRAFLRRYIERRTR